MEITERHIKIFNAEVCPYCGSKTRRTNQMEVYNKKYSDNEMIVCSEFPKCDSYVGCHSTGEPLGRLANKELRQAKKRAHYYFDQIWDGDKKERGYTYYHLQQFLGIPKEFTHIGMFSIRTCEKVVLWSMEILDKKGIN